MSFVIMKNVNGVTGSENLDEIKFLEKIVSGGKPSIKFVYCHEIDRTYELADEAAVDSEFKTLLKKLKGSVYPVSFLKNGNEVYVNKDMIISAKHQLSEDGKTCSLTLVFKDGADTPITSPVIVLKPILGQLQIEVESVEEDVKEEDVPQTPKTDNTPDIDNTPNTGDNA